MRALTRENESLSSRALDLIRSLPEPRQPAGRGSAWPGRERVIGRAGPQRPGPRVRSCARAGHEPPRGGAAGPGPGAPAGPRRSRRSPGDAGRSCAEIGSARRGPGRSQGAGSHGEAMAPTLLASGRRVMLQVRSQLGEHRVRAIFYRVAGVQQWTNVRGERPPWRGTVVWTWNRGFFDLLERI